MSLRTRTSALASASSFLVTVLAAAQGHAQSGSAAQALFDQGKSLMAAGKASEACPKFEESQKLDPGSGTLINLALCYEKTGRTASAWSAYRDAAAAAAVAGNKERERGARDRAAALAPKVSKLTVEVPADSRVQGLAVTRDGVDVGPAQWGVPIPTDAGKHELVAKAPGHGDWRSTVPLGPDGGLITVTVPRLAVAATPVAGAAPAVAAAAPAEQGQPTETVPAESKSGGLGGQRIVALVAGGVGVAGVAVGTIFGVQALSKHSKAKESCDGTACTTNDGVDAGNDAHKAGTISTIGMVVGAVGIAAGVTLWVTAPKSSSTQVGVWPGGVVLRRSF
jgi:hypothetical protein